MNNNSYYFAVLIWFVIACIAGYTGAVKNVLPPLIIFTIVVVLILMSVFAGSFRSWVCSIPLNNLVAIHLTRFVGFYFLYLYGKGVLPYEFAVYGGWGDIAVAALALTLIVLSADGVVKSPVYYFLWNMFGLIDILFVVGIAAKLFFANPENMAELIRLPLSLLPTFLVPIIIFSHLVIFYRLKKKDLPVI